MSRLCVMMTIVERNLGEKCLRFFHENQQEIQLVTLGRGTANDEMLDYFGLESRDKAVLFTIVTEEKWKLLKRGLIQKMQIDAPGVGVAFLLPLSSIAGAGVFQYLTKNLNYEKEEETALKETKYEMIVAVANQGYIEPIMEAARRANAGGGTVIHAKGTGMEGMGKFLGVTLAAEKEMIFIVSRSEQKNEIMRAIMEEAGMHTKARTFLFSVPVTGTVGLRSLDEEEK